MKIYSEKSFSNLETWGGASATKDVIISFGLEEEMENLIDELFPDGVGETELNDFLWFDDDYIFESLGIINPYGDDDEEE